ncbi:MAG: aminotransferase class V-fold PLP-dependent enzyme, partial [Bifidobacteriaceae bacterium]|nr:aminotransferase class V-fold PLP-dependent enzyme [Bifidobacteriaceae bacterium]
MTNQLYFDYAATSPRIDSVIQSEQDFYKNHNYAIKRGATAKGFEADGIIEESRAKIAKYFGAKFGLNEWGDSQDEIVFTSGTTASINLISQMFLNATILGPKYLEGGSQNPFFLMPGDKVVVTQAEHHANLIPWQQLCVKLGLELAFLPLNPVGEILPDEKILRGAKILAFSGASNVSGVITQISRIVSIAKRVSPGVITVLDAAQIAQHTRLDFAALNVDFAAVSMHKLYGPYGVGVLFGRRELLDAAPVVNTGGSQVEKVTMLDATFQKAPAKFEPGTGNWAGIAASATAIDYLETVVGGDGTNLELSDGDKNVTKLLEKFNEIDGVTIIGLPKPPKSSSDFTLPTPKRLPLISFSLSKLDSQEQLIHPHDIGQFLDDSNIIVRVGHHCAQPIHQRFGLDSSVRLSPGPDTTAEEID